jgi:hypothetical protein
MVGRTEVKADWLITSLLFSVSSLRFLGGSFVRRSKALIPLARGVGEAFTWNEFRLFVEKECTGHILFVTKNGFIGLGPASMLLGDIVVI